MHIHSRITFSGKAIAMTAKKALLIGCNYPGMLCELRGCANDVERVYDCLVDRYGFLEEDITVLIDTDNKYTRPIGKNIRDALSRLVETASLATSSSSTSAATAIAKIEKRSMKTPGLLKPLLLLIWIPEDYDFMKFVERVPKNCKVTIVSDSCHSGGLIEGAKEQIGHSTRIRNQISRSLSLPCFSLFHPANEIDYSYMNVRSLSTSTLIDLLKEKYGKDDINEGNLRTALVDIFGEETVSPKFVKLDLMSTQLQGGSVKEGLLDGGILLSACQSEQKAFEVKFLGDGNIYGTFSNYIQDIIAENDGDVTNKELVLNARRKLKQQNLKRNLVSIAVTSILMLVLCADDDLMYRDKQ